MDPFTTDAAGRISSTLQDVSPCMATCWSQTCFLVSLSFLGRSRRCTLALSVARSIQNLHHTDG